MVLALCERATVLRHALLFYTIQQLGVRGRVTVVTRLPSCGFNRVYVMLSVLNNPRTCRGPPHRLWLTLARRWVSLLSNSTASGSGNTRPSHIRSPWALRGLPTWTSPLLLRNCSTVPTSWCLRWKRSSTLAWSRRWVRSGYRHGGMISQGPTTPLQVINIALLN